MVMNTGVTKRTGISEPIQSPMTKKNEQPEPAKQPEKVRVNVRVTSAQRQD
jgi:hypothetical protein